MIAGPIPNVDASLPAPVAVSPPPSEAVESTESISGIPVTKSTPEQFRADIDDIALDLVQAYGLTFGDPAAAANVDMALYRWLDYRLRHIQAQPRKVVKSARFPVQNLPSDIDQALGALEARFASGDDVNPFLSKTTIGNDVMAKKRQWRTDGMWADWRIHHFHLTSEPLTAGERFSARSGWLLFAMVYDDAVALIDVRSHNEADLWSQEELLKTFIDAWPAMAEPFRITGMRVDSSPTNSQDLGKLRRNGIVAPVEHNGQHYFGPGGGVTSSVTSTAVSMAAVAVRQNTRRLADALDSPDDAIHAELLSLGIGCPQFYLGVGDHGLVIADRGIPDRSWKHPALNGLGRPSAFSVVRDALLPDWAVPALMSHLRAEGRGPARR